MSEEDDALDLLLDRWEELRDSGQRCTPEELCREYPNLLEELRRKISAIEEMDNRYANREAEKPDEDANDAELTPSFNGILVDIPSEVTTRQQESTNNAPDLPEVGHGNLLFRLLPWLLVGILTIILILVIRSNNTGSEQNISDKSSASNSKKEEKRMAEWKEPKYQRLFAQHWLKVGQMLVLDKRYTEAESYLNLTTNQHKELAKTEPPSESFLKERVNAHFLLAHVLTQQKRIESAQDAYRTAILFQRVLTKEYTDNPDYLCQLGLSLNNLANLQVRENPKQAMESLKEAVICQENALQIRPNEATYRQCLCQHLTELLKLQDQQANSEAIREIQAKMAKYRCKSSNSSASNP